MAETEPLLELEDVAKRYEGAEGGAPVEVLSGISLRLNPGDSLSCVGPSGSGKSTLLNIMGTLDRPSAGRVLLRGRDLSELGDDELAAVRNRHVGFIFQLHHLLPQLTVLENVLVPTLADGGGARAETGGEDVQTRARRLLGLVGLSHRLAHRPGQLSGGERQRVAVVRALINAPELVLADEPTGSLDHAAAESLMDLLVTLNREEGVTMVVVTHALDLAGRLDRVRELRDGTLVAGDDRS
jgi:ABC-type lipoprotein export system ATPase subunit